MIIARTRQELSQTLKSLSKKPGKLSLIPTMGNLHDGHLSLLKMAKLHSTKTIATIFVNPLQFGKNEDYDKYPRTQDLDIEKLEKEECDILFVPSNQDEVFQDINKIKQIDSGPLGSELCGKLRPNHFNGVLTVVHKIFDMIKPDIAIFGAKDFQQQVLVRRMAQSYFPDLTIIKGATIRSKSGLALSSRNNYLSRKDLMLASNLFKCLQNSIKSYKNNKDINEIIQNALDFLKSKKLIVDYFELRDDELNIIEKNHHIGKKIFLGSVTINNTRLIDNIEF